MQILEKNLFGAKEMYRLSCTKTGKIKFPDSLSTTQIKKLTENNMHMTVGVECSEHGFPILEPYRGTLDYDFVAYGNHHKLDGKGSAIHFFVDDYKFSKACDENLDQTTFKLLNFDCLFTPDYSLYVDMPIQMNMHNIYRSRFAGAFWRKHGFDVIPTASWSDADSFSYCFEGLPSHSVIAVCGTGVKWCSASYQLWQYGMRALEETLSPTTIIVYGSGMEVPGLQTPIVFIQDVISKKFRK